jgi:hypothetical protein
MVLYDTATDRVHGIRWPNAGVVGGWVWREPRYGDHFRTCSFCGSIHPEDLAAALAGTGICRTCGQAGWEACFGSQKPAWMGCTERDDVLACLTSKERADVEAMPDTHPYDPGGWWASWADRKYGWPHKFYVRGLNPADPGLPRYMGSTSGDEPPAGSTGWIRGTDLTAEQKQILTADGCLGDRNGWNGCYLLGVKPELHAKFYTTHLNDPRISQDVKDTIQRVSGLQFTWTGDGKVTWDRWTEPTPGGAS